MADISNTSLVDEREEAMISPNGGHATLRNAHFLKPTFAFNSHLLPPSPSLLYSKPTFNQLKISRLECYKGYPSEMWKTWVHILKPKYQEIWKKAGIYEAILASTYIISRANNLIIDLAKSWCGQTNTFIFPWGEVTITLEDIMYLGNYSVLGTSITTPLPKEFTDIYNGMREAHRKARLGGNANVTGSMWIKYFMCSGKQLEHEAFIAMWLSRFVLVQSQDYIALQHFRVAIHLSRGTRIALAPVVLSIIYRDMRLLHNAMAESKKLEHNSDKRGVSHVDLVQMWIWERFPDLRPNPNVMERGEPRSARWNGVTNLKVKDVSAALDSAGNSFLWRPYAIISSDCMLTEIYRDNEQWIVVESDESEAFARFLRVSNLVGLGYIEQYHPNRVAMQFGLDQDVPPHVIRSNEDLETAWCSYNRPVRDAKLYVPPRLFESDVSSRYLEWWRGLVPAINEDATRLPLIYCRRKRDSVATPGCTSKGLKQRLQDTVEEDSLTIAQFLSQSRSSSYKNSKDTHKEPVLALCNETHTKYMCTTQPVEFSMPSSEKCEKGNSSIKKQIEPAENAFLSQVNQPDGNIVDSEDKSHDKNTSKVPELELETRILRLEEENIIDTTCNKTTSEAPIFELKTRILRLEMIANMIKTAKFASSSRGKI